MNANEIRHGYGHDPGSRPFDALEGSFAYHLRRHRQAYGKNGLSQRALAMLAHVSRTFIERLEESTSFLGSVEPLLRVAIALRQPIEALVSPSRLSALEGEIERRRSLLGGDARLGSGLPRPEARRILLAATYRTPHLVLAISADKLVLDIRGHRIRPDQPLEQMHSLIERVAKAHGVSEILVESGTKASKCMPFSRPRREITFARAKQYVFGASSTPAPSNKVFFKSLVEAHPELARHVKVLPLTGAIAMTERWRTARLIAATLALAAAAAEPSGAERPRPEA